MTINIQFKKGQPFEREIDYFLLKKGILEIRTADKVFDFDMMKLKQIKVYNVFGDLAYGYKFYKGKISDIIA